MNNKERVLACLSHQQPDRVPYNIGFTQKAYKRMVEFYDDQNFASKLNNCLRIVPTTHKESWKEIEAHRVSPEAHSRYSSPSTGLAL